VYRQLVDKVKTFIVFSIALDESTDISDTAQLVIRIRGVDKELNITEDFLDLVAMTDSTTGANILKAVEDAIDAVGLSWEILYSATTDEAPANGEAQGFCSFLKKTARTDGRIFESHPLPDPPGSPVRIDSYAR